MSISEPRALPSIDPDVVEHALDELRRDGIAIVPGVLTADEAGSALERLWAASAKSQRRGVSAHVANLDPNDSNVRVFDLIDLDPLFAELIAHPTADAIVSGLLGRDYIVSNFTANIARPGSASMVVHSDLSAVMPEPWMAPLSVNVIWCLTDVHPDNGATLHIPREPPLPDLRRSPARPSRTHGALPGSRRVAGHRLPDVCRLHDGPGAPGRRGHGPGLTQERNAVRRSTADYTPLVSH